MKGTGFIIKYKDKFEGKEIDPSTLSKEEAEVYEMWRKQKQRSMVTE